MPKDTDPQNARKARRRKPLTHDALVELGLYYVGRYATSRAKLARYLDRKLRERGWEGERPDIAAIVEKMDARGYVDDQLYAATKARALVSRGYGARRLSGILFEGGIEETDAGEARDIAQSNRVDAALTFARRKRLGPYALDPVTDPKLYQKKMAAMLRAGHGPALSRAILDLEPGSIPDEEELALIR